eukprot:793735-Prymnesium_polylepis.1
MTRRRTGPFVGVWLPLCSRAATCTCSSVCLQRFEVVIAARCGFSRELHCERDATQCAGPVACNASADRMARRIVALGDDDGARMYET